jgi:hypothetical protein
MAFVSGGKIETSKAFPMMDIQLSGDKLRIIIRQATMMQNPMRLVFLRHAHAVANKLLMLY